jgi:hypothetical protein
MNTQRNRSKQTVRKTWTREQLDRERAIALGQAIDTSTWSNYSSAVNSYLDFVKNHNFPIEPTPDTLSYFVVYMSHHIKPNSVDTYLSGVCQQLEPFFPDVHKHRNSLLVNRTLRGCKRLHISPIKRKRALTRNDLHTVIKHYQDSSSHDDLLFVAQLLVGFFALMRLGELTTPDDLNLRNPSKISKRTSVVVNDDSFQFFLPSHKADKFFEGNTIVLMKSSYSDINTFHHFCAYLSSRDRLFPFSSPLWLTSDGSIPSRSFFLHKLHLFFGNDVAGQSLRAGGATDLALGGTPPSLIQTTGRWTSESFRIYVRKSPVLIHALRHPACPSPVLHQF